MLELNSGDALRTPCCANCRFHNGEECRRYPPQVYYQAKDNVAVWLFPDTMSDDWCGEWRARRVPPGASTGTPEEVLDLPVRDFLLNVRLPAEGCAGGNQVARAIKAAWRASTERNSMRVRHLVVLSRDDLLLIKNCGPSTLAFIEAALAQYGLRLANGKPPSADE